MPVPQKVLPGDLITADYMNQIIDLLALHENELQTLMSSVPGASAAIAVASILPTAPRIGEELQVYGHGFGLLSLDVITLDGVAVSVKPVSNDGLLHSNESLLIFDVPSVPSVPASGRNVTLKIVAAAGTAPYTFQLLPPLPKTQGTITLTFSGTQQNGQPFTGKLLAGQTYDFLFALAAVTTQADTYTVQANVTAGSAPVILNLAGDGGPLPSPLVIPQSPTWFNMNLHVQATIPANATGPCTIQLAIASTSTRSFGQIGGVQFTVGDNAPAGTQLGMTLQSGVVRTQPAKALTLGQTLNLPTGVETDLKYAVVFQHTQGGNYKVAAAAKDHPELWNVKLLAPAPDAAQDPTKGSFAMADPPSGGSNTFFVVVSLTPSALAPATSISVNVTSDPNPNITGSLPPQSIQAV